MSTTDRNALGDIWRADAGKFPAAPETRTSISPNDSDACCRAVAVASGSRTSAALPPASAPSARSRRTAASTLSGERLITATLAPAAANPSAIPRLIPLVPPATKACAPVKSTVTVATARSYGWQPSAPSGAPVQLRVDHEPAPRPADPAAHARRARPGQA